MTDNMYSTRVWLGHIEQLWRDQRTSFPSIFRGRYKFPKSIDYYRYLDNRELARHIEKLSNILTKLQEDETSIVMALDLCYSMTPDGFKKFLSVIPWILTAHKVVPDLDGFHRSIEDYYLPDNCSRNEKIEALQKQRKIFDDEILHLTESIRAIELIASCEPKPMPFIDMRRNYADGEIVVGFYDGRYQEWASPRLAVVSDSSIGTYHTAIRPLTEEEFEHRPVELPNLEEQLWMHKASFEWIMPLEAYQYYLKHPGLVDEHIDILERSGFELEIPITLKVISRHLTSN